MKKIKKPNFLEWNKNIFVSSIKKINLNIILIVILDILFYFLSGYLVISWLQRIQLKMATFNLPTDIAALGYERAQQLVSEVKTFYYLIIFSFIILLIAIIFLASIMKGIIWAKTTNTKISFRLISKFLVLNLIWMGFWLVLIFIILLVIEPKVVNVPKVLLTILVPSGDPRDLFPYFIITTTHVYIFIALVISSYFKNTLYTIFMKEQKLKSITHAIKLNILKIHLFLLPYVVIALSFFIIVRLNILLRFKYSTILLGLIILTYAAVVRYYTSTLVLEIEKSKPL